MKARAILFLASLLTSGAAAQDAPVLESFVETSPLAGNAELSRRLLSPLTVIQMRAALARAGQSLSDQSVTVAAEKFLVHVPPQMPANGYAALIFVPAQGHNPAQGLATGAGQSWRYFYRGAKFRKRQL